MRLAMAMVFASILLTGACGGGGSGGSGPQYSQPPATSAPTTAPQPISTPATTYGY